MRRRARLAAVLALGLTSGLLAGSPASATTTDRTPTSLNVIPPALLTMPIAIAALTIMPATFGGFREKGILRRFSATPMRPQSYSPRTSSSTSRCR